jgi:hypothetical protein
MSINFNFSVCDPDVEQLLAFLQNRFPNSFVTDHIYVMERAIKILRISDEYAPTKDQGHLGGVELGSDGASLIRQAHSYMRP